MAWVVWEAADGTIWQYQVGDDPDDAQRAPGQDEYYSDAYLDSLTNPRLSREEKNAVKRRQLGLTHEDRLAKSGQKKIVENKKRARSSRNKQKQRGQPKKRRR